MNTLSLAGNVRLVSSKGSELFALLHERNTPFIEIDSNIMAWLHETTMPTNESILYYYQLNASCNNKELVEHIGGEQNLDKTLVNFEQIRQIVERQLHGEDLLLTNGFSNLFFVSGKQNKIYIMGIVFNAQAKKFVPYIYRRHNLYRAWSRGNRVFLSISVESEE